jgi:hypothetical protein
LLARLFERTTRALARAMNRRGIAVYGGAELGDRVTHRWPHGRPRIMIEIDPHLCS